jgi:AraC family transcriptional regulator, exoenzyme S synthesis regulatory protein ExsA
MIVDIFNGFKEDPAFTKLVGSDYMIMEYKCPIETDEFQLMTEMHIITYVISGRKDWITPDNIYSVKEGEALFIKKGVYTARQYLDADHCILTFFINDDFIRRFLRENNTVRHSGGGVSGQQEQIFKLDVNDALRSLFHSVYNYLKLETGIPRNLVEIKFNELLFNIVLNPTHDSLIRFFTSLNQTNKTNLDHVMMQNFQHDLPLEDFARLCGRSLSAFKRDFNQFYQQTPGKWLKEKRLEHATTLLVNSDLHVNEIGYESGFKNSSHFNKAFKERYQVSPNQFRMKRKHMVSQV